MIAAAGLLPLALAMPAEFHQPVGIEKRDYTVLSFARLPTTASARNYYLTQDRAQDRFDPLMQAIKSGDAVRIAAFGPIIARKDGSLLTALQLVELLSGCKSVGGGFVQATATGARGELVIECANHAPSSDPCMSDSYIMDVEQSEKQIGLELFSRRLNTAACRLLPPAPLRERN